MSVDTRIASLESEISRLRGQLESAPVEQPSRQVLVQPYWEVMRLADGVAMAADWDDSFEDSTEPDRWPTRRITSAGEFFLGQWTTHHPARLRMQIDARDTYSAKYMFMADGAGTYQLRVNGELFTLGAGTTTGEIKLKQGRNLVAWLKDATGADRIEFECVLFDGIHSTWVNPNQ